jgi:hypothetical protein
MDDEQLHVIAAESDDVRSERSALQEKLGVLIAGKQILYEHIGKPPSERDTTHTDIFL